VNAFKAYLCLKQAFYDSFKKVTFAMTPQNDIELDEDSAEHRRKWNKLKDKHGPKLEERVRVIRAGPWHITRAEARNSALAELEYSVGAAAAALGVEENTVTNHHTRIRQKTEMSRKECDFDMIFIRLLPPDEKNEQ
jgi:hypothetical protein